MKTNNGSDPYMNEMNGFFDLIKGKEKNSNEIDHAFQVLALIQGTQ